MSIMRLFFGPLLVILMTISYQVNIRKRIENDD